MSFARRGRRRVIPLPPAPRRGGRALKRYQMSSSEMP
jgi:hypothetical protein